MFKKIVDLVITDILIYLVSFVFVYIGFNLLLPWVFDFIPKLSCFKIFILTLAINCLFMPVRIEIEMYIKKKFERE
jgi:hypothetical protein